MNSQKPKHERHPLEDEHVLSIHNSVLSTYKTEQSPAICCTRMELEGITVTKVSWAQKDKCCMFLLTYSSYNDWFPEGGNRMVVTRG